MQDMLGALELVDSVRKVIDECRNNAKEVFSDIMKKCSGLCDTAKVQRKCERQNNWSNHSTGCLWESGYFDTDKKNNNINL